jgi:hypothetical protein
MIVHRSRLMIVHHKSNRRWRAPNLLDGLARMTIPEPRLPGSFAIRSRNWKLDGGNHARCGTCTRWHAGGFILCRDSCLRCEEQLGRESRSPILSGCGPGLRRWRLLLSQRQPEAHEEEVSDIPVRDRTRPASAGLFVAPTRRLRSCEDGTRGIRCQTDTDKGRQGAPL